MHTRTHTYTQIKLSKLFALSIAGCMPFVFFFFVLLLGCGCCCYIFQFVHSAISCFASFPWATVINARNKTASVSIVFELYLFACFAIVSLLFFFLLFSIVCLHRSNSCALTKYTIKFGWISVELMEAYQKMHTNCFYQFVLKTDEN